MTTIVIISIYFILVIISSITVLPIYLALQKELALLSEYNIYRLTTLICAVGFIAFPLYLLAAFFTYLVCLVQYLKLGQSFSQTIKEIYETED